MPPIVNGYFRDFRSKIRQQGNDIATAVCKTVDGPILGWVLIYNNPFALTGHAHKSMRR